MAEPREPSQDGTLTLPPLVNVPFEMSSGLNTVNAGLLFVQEQNVVESLLRPASGSTPAAIGIDLRPITKGLLFRATITPGPLEGPSLGDSGNYAIIARLDAAGDQALMLGSFDGFAEGSVFRFQGQVGFPFIGVRTPAGFGLGQAMAQRGASDEASTSVPMAVEYKKASLIRSTGPKPLTFVLTGQGLVYLYGEGEILRPDGTKTLIREGPGPK